jgi:hypothetical protein
MIEDSSSNLKELKEKSEDVSEINFPNEFKNLLLPFTLV